MQRLLVFFIFHLTVNPMDIQTIHILHAKSHIIYHWIFILFVQTAAVDKIWIVRCCTLTVVDIEHWWYPVCVVTQPLTHSLAILAKPFFDLFRLVSFVLFCLCLRRRRSVVMHHGPYLTYTSLHILLSSLLLKTY